MTPASVSPAKGIPSHQPPSGPCPDFSLLRSSLLLTQHRVGLSCEAIPSPTTRRHPLGRWSTSVGDREGKSQFRPHLSHRRASLVHPSHHELFIFPGLCMVLFIHRVSHVGTYLCPSTSKILFDHQNPLQRFLSLHSLFGLPPLHVPPSTPALTTLDSVCPCPA